MKNNVLIVAAHPDDEVLGAGGTIIKYRKNKDDVSILILGDGETSRSGMHYVEKRENEAKNVASKLGAQNLFLKKFPDNQFDKVPLIEITKEIERIVKKIKPSILYTHSAHDLNIDHRLTFEAVLTACRPQPNFCVNKILSFEVLSSTEWQSKDSRNAFCPTEYVNIEKEIEEKIDILKTYKNELKKFPHPRSVKGVKTLAEYRGMEVGFNFAEAFYIVRSLKDIL